MKNKKSYLVAVSLLLLLFAGCQDENSVNRSIGRDNQNIASSDERAGNSSAISQEDGIVAEERKLMKNANLRCRVSNVYEAVASMEQLTRQIGGLVMESDLINTVMERRTVPYLSDSLQELQTYTTTAQLELRIPVSLLDTVMNRAVNNASFTESRTISQTDATLAYLSNQLKNEAAQQSQLKAIAKNMEDATVGAAYSEESSDRKVDRKIENLGIIDKVHYATLKIHFYQPAQVDVLVISDTDKRLAPGFGYRIGNALAGGWDLVKMLFLGLLYLWPMLLAAVVVFFLILRFKRKKTGQSFVRNGR